MTPDPAPSTAYRPASPVASHRPVPPATAPHPVPPIAAPHPVPPATPHRPVTVSAAVGPVSDAAVLRPAPHQAFTSALPCPSAFPFTSETRTMPAGTRRGSPLLAAQHGQRGVLSRPADQGRQGPYPPAGPRRRGFPGPASARPTAPHSTPVPLCAQHTTRAIRERRSPR